MISRQDQTSLKCPSHEVIKLGICFIYLNKYLNRKYPVQQAAFCNGLFTKARGIKKKKKNTNKRSVMPHNNFGIDK